MNEKQSDTDKQWKLKLFIFAASNHFVFCNFNKKKLCRLKSNFCFEQRILQEHQSFFSLFYWKFSRITTAVKVYVNNGHNFVLKKFLFSLFRLGNAVFWGMHRIGNSFFDYWIFENKTINYIFLFQSQRLFYCFLLYCKVLN